MPRWSRTRPTSARGRSRRRRVTAQPSGQARVTTTAQTRRRRQDAAQQRACAAPMAAPVSQPAQEQRRCGRVVAQQHLTERHVREPCRRRSRAPTAPRAAVAAAAPATARRRSRAPATAPAIAAAPTDSIGPTSSVGRRPADRKAEESRAPGRPEPPSTARLGSSCSTSSVVPSCVVYEWRRCVCRWDGVAWLVVAGRAPRQPSDGSPRAAAWRRRRTLPRRRCGRRRTAHRRCTGSRPGRASAAPPGRGAGSSTRVSRAGHVPTDAARCRFLRRRARQTRAASRPARSARARRGRAPRRVRRP